MNLPKLKYYANYNFLQRNFFFLLIIAAISFYWFNHYTSLQGDTAKVQIFLSMITLGFCGIIFAFSLLTALPPYLWFWFKKRVLETEDEEREDIIKINFKDPHPQAGSVKVEIRLFGVRKPRFGFARVKLIFDDYLQSKNLLLEKRIKEGRKNVGIMTRRAIELPNIRDYRIQASFIHFEDFFHLFSLPYKEVEHIGVFTEPPAKEPEEVDIKSDKSEEAVLKVKQHKVARGEMIDYKKYAPGDDIRRIIWKNYARNRELTVRIPERNYPYVSHINVLTSFYDGSPSQQQLELKDFLLDIYKEKLRQIVDALIEQEFNINFIPDQNIDTHYQLDEYQQILYKISASTWQYQLPADRFLTENFQRLRSGSNLLIFSSLCPVNTLTNLRNGRFADYNLFLYDISQTLSMNHRPSILKQIFLVDAWEPLAAAQRKLNARNTIKYISNNGEKIKSQFHQSKLSVI